MEVQINIDDYLENKKIDTITFQKMLLIYNALDEGWTVKKKNEAFIFTKKHENKREILEESYLLKFMKTNLDLGKYIT
jgi:hypothetical protein